MKKSIFLSWLCLVLFFSSAVMAQNSISDYEKELFRCHHDFIKKEQECPEKGSFKCHDFLMNLNQETQKCIKGVGVQILQKFYALSEGTAQNKLNDFSRFIYDNYLFVSNNTIYCTQNNCGGSPYLNSEYTTTQALNDYVQKMINTIASRD